MITLSYPDNAPQAHFTGRNGYFKQSGIELLKSGQNMIIMSPITSRGEVARCDMEVPLDTVPALIDALIQFRDGKM